MRIVLILLMGMFYAFSSQAQKSVISGYIKDAATGESLNGAVVQVYGKDYSAPSNSYGYYAVTVDQGNLKLIVTFVGYHSIEKEITLDKNVRLDFELKREELEIEEVVISNRAGDENVRRPQMGSTKLTMQEVKNIPVIFGEKDILKTIQYLPGVSSGGEGSSNFFVRGGAGDQNLILLDEATVYNASHLFGFFSTFNSDAIKDATLYKGGIPAQYGGRISSVLDVSMLDGNNKNYSVEGGLGLIASRLKIEGPIVKDKSSFMISGRRTYADLFLKLSKDENVNKSKLYFYDLNAKMNYRLNDNNTLYISGYFGLDEMAYSDLFSFDWGNKTATIRWNHIFNERLFSNTTFVYSDFSYNVNVSGSNTDFVISSLINNYNFKQDFSFYTNNRHNFKFGLNALYSRVNPASIDAAENTGVNSLELESKSGLELAGYVSHEWKLSDRFSSIAGVRLNNFMALGPGHYYEYDELGNPVNEKYYPGRNVVSNYMNIEPRLSMSYLLNNSNSVKASYNRIAQNLHQLTNTTSSLPTDQYIISSNNVKPQIADLIAVGYFQNFKDNQYEFSFETYYKWLGNQIDFRNGADLQANVHLEGELLNGIGRAYGMEWLVKKNKGKWNGWLSYSLSKSERKFEEINEGTWFNSRQDRTHDISLVLLYNLSKRWTLGSTFSYYTGNAVTFPSGKYKIDNQTMYYYTERNGYRMPDYHRLDLSVTYEKENLNKKWNSSWSFGVYNAYNRKNAYLIDFRDNESNPNVIETYRIALFGIIPSVTWNFSF